MQRPVQQNKYLLYDTENVPFATGMSNTGAICWWNSLLQSMLGISALSQVMLDYETEFVGNPFACAYIEFLLSTYNDTVRNDSSIKLFMVFGKQVIAKTKINLVNGQQCANEGFTLFIEMLDNRRVEKIFTSSYEITSTCKNPACKNVAVLPRDNAFYVTLNYNTLDSESFHHWMRVHERDPNPRKCEVCGHCEQSSKPIEKLKRLSEVVVVLLNKITIAKTNMYFPSTLTFLSNTGNDIKYKLVAKIEHGGGSVNMSTFSSSGHYWAHSLRDEVWQCCNDTSVSPGNASPTAGTLMIMYHMVA